MKLIVLILTLFVSSFSVFAGETEELFSPKERQEVIRSIDDACGDTWCEGDYNFKFINFSCNKRALTCDLSFHFIKTDEQSVETYSPVQVCHFQNIRNFKQIKEDKSSLNESFYEELTDCITTHEYSVRF